MYYSRYHSHCSHPLPAGRSITPAQVRAVINGKVATMAYVAKHHTGDGTTRLTMTEESIWNRAIQELGDMVMDFWSDSVEYFIVVFGEDSREAFDRIRGMA